MQNSSSDVVAVPEACLFRFCFCFWDLVGYVGLGATLFGGSSGVAVVASVASLLEIDADPCMSSRGPTF